MPELKSKSAKKPFLMLLGVILLAFTFLLGYSVGLEQARKQKDAGYQAAVDDIKVKLEETGLMPPAVETNTIDGAVTAVGEGLLEVDAAQLVNNPLETPAPVKRRVLVNADTKITKSVPLSPDEMEAALATFEAEQKKFDAAVRAGQETEPPMPPASSTVQEIGLADIAPGDQIRAAAANNITFASEFTAIEITVLGRNEAPPEEPAPGEEPELPLP